MKKVVVSGYLDPLHRGHCENMRLAAQLGDCLIVIMSSDEQIKRKYGYVLQPLHKRIERLVRKASFIQGIFVSIDKDSTQVETLKLIKPDVFAKGGDRTLDNMPQAELDVCKEIGCRVVYGLGGKVNSSTAMRERIEKFRRGKGEQK